MNARDGGSERMIVGHPPTDHVHGRCRSNVVGSELGLVLCVLGLGRRRGEEDRSRRSERYKQAHLGNPPFHANQTR